MNTVNTTQSSTVESYAARTSGLKFPDYIGYGLGDFSFCLVFGLVGTLLQKFYTDIFLLNPLWIMFMMIAARLWDAVNDPIMGRICDTAKVSKHGRYRPWLLRAAFFLAPATLLMFIKWPGLGNTPDHIGTFAYATITYIIFGMFYTMGQIPYGSLASVVTTNSDERSKLSVFRSVGSILGNLPILVLASFCFIDRINENGEKVIGENGIVIQDMTYNTVLIGVSVFVVLMLIGLFASFKLNKERVPTTPNVNNKKGETKRLLKGVLSNRAFMSICIAAMLLLSAQMFTSSFNMYLFADYFGKSWMNMVVMLCLYSPILFVMLIISKMVKRFGKKELCAAGVLVSAISCLLMFAFRNLMPAAWWLYLALSFLCGIGQSFIILLVWALVTDAIDDIAVKCGIKEDGTAYAGFMFFRKIGQMLAAIAVNGALLGMHYNYTKGAVQTLENLKSMYDLATIIPAVLFGIMAFILFVWYPLSKRRVAELQIDKINIIKEQFENQEE